MSSNQTEYKGMTITYFAKKFFVERLGEFNTIQEAEQRIDSFLKAAKEMHKRFAK